MIRLVHNNTRRSLTVVYFWIVNETHTHMCSYKAVLHISIKKKTDFKTNQSINVSIHMAPLPG